MKKGKLRERDERPAGSSVRQWFDFCPSTPAREMRASSVQLTQRATPTTEIDKSDLCVTVDLVTGLQPY